MNIAIIGTGNVGGALAKRWANNGHAIYLGVRHTSQFKGMHLLAHDNITAHNIQEAVAIAEVILVATPPQIAEELVPQMGKLTGKTIIDATNAIRSTPPNYPTAYHAFAALTKAEVVKCFNTTGYENMLNPNFGNQALDLFMAGDSTIAKKIAADLATDVGFAHCFDFGGADQVILLEQFALAWINLVIRQGQGRNIGFKLLSR